MSTERDVLAWDLADRLQKAMRVGGVSVNAMAEELGVHRNTVTAYIHGYRRPKLSALRVWALRCGVPLEWLATGKAPASDSSDGGSVGSGWLNSQRCRVPVSA